MAEAAERFCSAVAHPMMKIGNTLLRQPEDQDLPFLTELRNDFELQAQLMALPRANSVERVRDWLQRASTDPAGVFFVIAESDSMKAVGFVQLGHMETVHGHAELGIAVGPAFHGRGHGKHAILLLEQYARRTFNIRKLHLRVLESNSPAIQLYERTGFDTVGILRKHHFHDGTFHDVRIMEKFVERQEVRA